MKMLSITTNGEQLYDITDAINEAIHESAIEEGIILLFCPHTSCALTISEAYDRTAREDLEAFLKHLAPRNLAYIRHDVEGPDDSPSHMKSILLQPSLTLMVKERTLVLGSYQGVYLAEFRDRARKREVWWRFF